MKRIFGKIFSSLLFCLFCLYAVAQNSYDITLPFACGFEDTLVENHNWIIKAGVNAEKCGDQWMIGNLDYREGYNSLYLSSDTGKTMTFGVKPNCVIARLNVIISVNDCYKHLISIISNLLCIRIHESVNDFDYVFVSHVNLPLS